MFTDDEDILNEIVLTKNSKPATAKGYRFAVNKYTECHNLKLYELLNEADREEQERIPLRERKIKSRFVQFKQYLLKEGVAKSTVNAYVVKIKAIYSFYDFQLPQIHYVKNDVFRTINDIPTLDDVKIAIENTNNIKLQAMILFIVSSGCGRTEMLNLTVNDFIIATKDYHTSYNISDVINSLFNRKDVIPLFHVLRQKTNKPYYCCCSNEAVQKICIMLKQRMQTENIGNDDNLFDVAPSYANKLFKNINDKCGWGFVNSYRYFRMHTLRMRFETELAKAQIDSNYYNHMVGHSLDKVQEAYIRIDPELVRTLYKKVVSNLCIYEKVSYIELNSEDRLELISLRRELMEIKNKLTERGYK